MRKFYITTPIYYASGKPHIGHAFTTIYADVINRYRKTQGNETFFVAGLDEHGSKIAEQAKADKKTPQEFVDEIAKTYKNTWLKLDVAYDDFVRTTSKKHIKGVEEFIKRLRDKGDIYEGQYEGLYCVDCEKFLSEKELINGLCPDHLKPPQKVKERNYFFNLKKYLPAIKDGIKNGEINISPESRKNEILSIIENGVPDFSITREKVKWGIPYPYDKNQTIYVWTEALMSYISILDFPKGEKFKKFWPADLHLIGADINKFHSIFWPGLLSSVGLPLPKKIFVHGLFTVNGQKMSKTLGNIIDPLKMIEDFGVDAARYLLLSQFPASEHGDIKEPEFKTKYNADLANGLGNLFQRIFTMVLSSEIKIGKKIDPAIQKWIEKSGSNYKNAMENLDLFEALKAIFTLLKKLDRYINETEPWKLDKTNKEKLAIILNSLFEGSEKINKLISPFMPQKSEQVRNYIKKIKEGKIGKMEKLNLFPRI